MAELGSGAGTGYPGAIDTDNTTEVNSPNAGKTKARAEVINDLNAAVIAVQTELGTDPAGSLTTVKAYLLVEHAADGTHSADISLVTPIITDGVMAGSSFTADDAAGPAIMNEAATSINPTLIPNKAEPGTGIGWALAELHFIINGTSRAILTAAQFVTGIIRITTNVGSGTPTPNAIYKENIAKAWLHLDGELTPANIVGNGFNITSVTDVGLGNYTVTWDVDFANVNYAPIACGEHTVANVSIDAQAVGSIDITSTRDVGSVNIDQSIFISAIGEQA